MSARSELGAGRRVQADAPGEVSAEGREAGA